MSLVNVKCPNCGAEIQLDSSREEGFCSYCGSKVLVKEAINKVKIDKSGDIQNFLQLAESALNSNNYEECLTYANKALEVDSNNSRAWILKMKAVDVMGSIKNHLRISEFQETGLKAVASANGNDEILKEVYLLFLIKAKIAIQFCNNQIRDVENLRKYHTNMMLLDFDHASEKTSQFDESMINNIDMISKKAVDLKNCIPIDFITSNNVYCKIVTEMAEAYVSYSEGFNDRLNIYGHHLADSAISARKYILDLIKKGLPEEQFANVDVSRINNEQVTQKQGAQGCYIATAVYGAYDCPEVWTLRRYRDFTLDKTWYGRLLIKSYYKISPFLVRYFGNTSLFRLLGKRLLDKLVDKLNRIGYKNTPYSDNY